MLKRLVLGGPAAVFVFALILMGGVTPSSAAQFKIPLYKLSPEKMLPLKCTSGSRTMYIPIPERWIVHSASVDVHYINSSNLIESVSSLAAIVNDTKVTQVKLDPKDPEKNMHVSIPPQLLKADYNEMMFQVAQHYIDRECEQPCAPDLWTYINTEASWLDIEYELKPVPLNLGLAIDFAFDARIFSNNVINIVMEERTPEMTTIAGIVASGIAKKYNYREVSFNVSDRFDPEHDNIFIAKAAYAQEVLAKYGHTMKIKDPSIKVMHLPYRNAVGMASKDPYHALFVLSGETIGDVKIAAETFAIMSFPFPGTDEMTIQEFTLPDITLYSGKGMVTTEKLHRFRALDFKTHTFRGMQSAPQEIAFRLPADFLIKQNDYAKMKLNFAYGAGMRIDSALNILLNGTHVRAINLANQGGDSITGYELELPTYLFKPGTNVLRFDAMLTPQAKECDLIQPESFFLTIFDNSTFYIPAMPHLIEMPKIELWMLNGFPLTRWPDGYESFFLLTNKDTNSLNALLNVMGVITQKNGFPLLGVQIGYELPNGWDGDLMVLGDVATIPAEIMAASPLKLGLQSEVPYPVITGGEGLASMHAVVKETGSLGKDAAVVMEFESPYKKARSVIMMVAVDTEDLFRLSKAVQDPGLQGRLEGSVSVVGLAVQDYRVDSLSVGEKYLTGKKGEVSKFERFLYDNPYFYYVLWGVVFVAVSLLLGYAAKRFRAKFAGASDAKMNPWQLVLSILSKMFLRKK